MRETESVWTTPGGWSLAWTEWAPDDEPRACIILVHGLGEHQHRYIHVIQRYVSMGYAVIGFDHRGHGTSSGQRGHIPSYNAAVADIDHFVTYAQTRYPKTPCFLYGHSLGGSLVLYYGFKIPGKVSGIIATSPGLSPAEPIPGWKLLAGKILSRLTPSVAMANGLILSGLSQDPVIVKAYQDDPLTHDRVSAALGTQIIDCGKWMLRQKRTYAQPVLLIHGTADRLTSHKATEQFSRQIKGDITFVPWPNGFHELHNEPFQDQVLQTIVDWLVKKISNMTPA